MTRPLITLIAMLMSFSIPAEEPGQVMLFGTFHFKDAGKDVVKMEDINIFEAESQAYLEALTSRLAETRPTQVLLEYNPESEAAVNQRYRDYLAGNFELPANEIYQLGFRIAKKAGLEQVRSFDNRDVPWESERMFAYGKEHDASEMALFDQLIKEFIAGEEKARANLSLGEMLARSNDPVMDRLNMDSYLVTNSMGAGRGYEGADSTASWWRRNFRMYANIQQHAQPGERVIAIAGSGHTAILKTLLGIDRRLQAMDVLPYLETRESEGRAHR